MVGRPHLPEHADCFLSLSKRSRMMLCPMQAGSGYLPDKRDWSSAVKDMLSCRMNLLGDSCCCSAMYEAPRFVCDTSSLAAGLLASVLRIFWTLGSTLKGCRLFSVQKP